MAVAPISFERVSRKMNHREQGPGVPSSALVLRSRSASMAEAPINIRAEAPEIAAVWPLNTALEPRQWTEQARRGLASTDGFGLAARRSSEFGAEAFDLFAFRAASGADRYIAQQRGLPADFPLTAYFCGTVGMGGTVNGLPMSGEWFRLPSDAVDARWNATMVGPVNSSYGLQMSVPTRLGVCGDPSRTVVPFVVGRPPYDEPERAVRLCPAGSVMNALGELLDGEWLRLRLNPSGSADCAYYEDSVSRGARPAGPPWSDGGSRVAIVSALALAALAAGSARKSRR